MHCQVSFKEGKVGIHFFQLICLDRDLRFQDAQPRCGKIHLGKSFSCTPPRKRRKKSQCECKQNKAVKFQREIQQTVNIRNDIFIEQLDVLGFPTCF